MGIFDGKRLLELGTNVASVDIVNYAKSEGAYIIVTDYLPPEQSEAKRYADESYMISTLDIDKLAALVKERRIDGVFCGVSEVNLKSVQTVAEMTGLPCYFTKEQWELSENKAGFKALCTKYNVPVAKQFPLSIDFNEEDMEHICYPVIVKPVDLCASRGIHICKDEEELKSGYRDAYEKSPSHRVLVEEYIVGDEISATYTFVNGECRLSMLSQMYYNLEQDGLVPLPDAYIYPSKHLAAYLKNVDALMRNMLKSIGIQNGSVFVTGMATDDKFAFFESGLRIAGTAPYKFVDNVNGINIMHLMTEYAINGCVSDPSVIEREDPALKGKICCLFSLLNGGGKIASIRGMEKASSIPGVIHTTVQRGVGDVVKKDGTLGQINLRFYIVGDTMDEIRSTIGTIQREVSVTDEDGNDMLLKSTILKNLR